MVSHHNKLRDVFLDIAKVLAWVHIGRWAVGLGTPIHNPALQMFLSLTGTLANLLPLTPSVLLEASMTAGSTALVAENKKHKYKPMIGSVRNWVGSASHLWSRPMGVGVLQQWWPFLSSLVAFPPG